MNLRTRLTVLFSLLCTAILAVSFSLIYFTSKAYLKNDFEKRLTDKAITTAVLLLHVEEIDSLLLKTIDRAKRDNLSHENISIIDSQNQEIYTNNDTIQFSTSNSHLERIRAQKKVFYTENEFEIVGLIYFHQNKDYVILAGAVDEQGVDKLRQLKFLLLTLLLVLVTVVAFVGWVYAGRALSPIQKIIGQVSNLSTTDLSQRLSQVKEQDEIHSLIKHFNNLLARIENAFSMQKSFVSNVSHELKNPLTKITSQLEVALLKPRTSEEHTTTLKSVLEDVKELNSLSASLLDMAMLEEGHNFFAMAPVRIDELILESRDRLLRSFPSYEIDLVFNKMPEEEHKLIITGNAHLLVTAFQNLIENACKFSFDKKASISLLIEEEIQIRIINRGPGIPSEVSEKVFQPFFRANNTAGINGHGIGLPLSEKIIQLHKGRLEMESIPNEVTVISLSFNFKS